MYVIHSIDSGAYLSSPSDQKTDPPIFVQVIDAALVFLFSWYSRNISQEQKLAAYAHLYSFTSVKAVVHWFQIMRTGAFQMYDDDAHSFYTKNFYHPVKVRKFISLLNSGTHVCV